MEDASPALGYFTIVICVGRGSRKFNKCNGGAFGVLILPDYMEEVVYNLWRCDVKIPGLCEEVLDL